MDRLSISQTDPGKESSEDTEEEDGPLEAAALIKMPQSRYQPRQEERQPTILEIDPLVAGGSRVRGSGCGHPREVPKVKGRFIARYVLVLKCEIPEELSRIRGL